MELLKRKENELMKYRTGSAVPHLDRSYLSDLEIVIPPQSLIEKFNVITEPLFRAIILNQQEVLILAKIRDALLPKLLSGEIRVKVDVEKERMYQQIGIRSHAKGVFHKELVSGEALGNKSVFWIEEDCFIVNIVFAWEQAVAKTTENEKGMIVSHRFPMYKAKDNRVDIDYILYFFKFKRGKHLLGLASPGGAGRNKTLGQKEFAELKIPLPPLKEQQKIARILTTWDDAISKQEALIEAKEQLKKGLMQNIINQSISQKISGGDVLESAAEIASPFGAAFQVLLHSVKDDSLALLSVLKGQGLARLLATPTLVAMSGQTARFNVGGEFPVPATDSEGSTNIDYKEYGVLLEFTPTVIGKETISLKVAPQVSSPDWTIGTTAGGVSVPGVKSRTASTTLRLKDGQTFVMAGLLKEESHVVTNKIPFLGDIPIMGTLFTSKEVEKNETELVIIVTPRLVKPLNKNEVAALPGDLIQDNISDLDFFFFNKTHNKMRPKEPEKKSRPGFEGQLGFAR